MPNKEPLENCNKKRNELEEEFAEKVEEELNSSFPIDVKPFRTDLRDGIMEVDVNFDKNDLKDIFEEKNDYNDFDIEIRGAAIGFLFKY